MFSHDPKLINLFDNLLQWIRETSENIFEMMAGLKVGKNTGR